MVSKSYGHVKAAPTRPACCVKVKETHLTGKSFLPLVNSLCFLRLETKNLMMNKFFFFLCLVCVAVVVVVAAVTAAATPVEVVFFVVAAVVVVAAPAAFIRNWTDEKENKSRTFGFHYNRTPGKPELRTITSPLCPIPSLPPTAAYHRGARRVGAEARGARGRRNQRSRRREASGYRRGGERTC